MRPTDIDPEVAAELDAIDATLAGDPVDPRHAEIAELALLLAAERPEPGSEFAASIDERVARRFVAADAGPQPRQRRRGWLAPAGLAASALAAAVVAIVVIGSGGGTSQRPQLAVPSAGLPRRTAGGSAAPRAQIFRAYSGAAASTSAARLTAAPAPQPNGRKVVQSAQLQLSAPTNRIDIVAQELFQVVGRENGVVSNSSVTSGAAGYAQFQLSIPGASLPATMTALSQLRYANVVSRTDATQDVNGEYLYDTRKLADDRALRTSLLKQLANATTQQQIDSLTARIHDAEASIRSDESTLRGLKHRIDFSQVTVTVNAASTPAPVHHSGTFTLGKAWHDAGRVLTVVAGAALIALAVLIPLGLAAALAWWIATVLRRRRREQALDLA